MKNETTYTIELSEVKDGTLADGSKGSLFYAVIHKDGEHIHTRQTLNPDGAKLLALELLAREFSKID